MVECLTSPNPRITEREVQKDMFRWLPVIAGIATKDEVEIATAEELAVWNEVAYQKINLTKSRGGVILIMADALRSSVIELDWKINNRSLERANEETDKILAKAARMEGTYQNSAKSIDGATTSLKRNSEGLKQNTDKVVQFGNRAKDSMQKTTSSAKQTEKQVKDVGSQFDKVKILQVFSLNLVQHL